MSDETLRLLSDAVQANPTNPDLWYELATVSDVLATTPEETAYYYTQAIRLSPFSQRFHSALITMWIDAGRPDLAHECFQVAVDLLASEDLLESTDLNQLYADAILHSLHQLNLDLARQLIDELSPQTIKKNPELLITVLAYTELHFADKEAEELLASTRPFVHVPKLPATRLNPARYCG